MAERKYNGNCRYCGRHNGHFSAANRENEILRAENEELRGMLQSFFDSVASWMVMTRQMLGRE